jgi:inhibitor of KinA sporulation pathway (predicted exonuclease)
MQKLLSLDLEFNQPSGRIIQIGAAIGDLATLKVERTLSALVKLEEALAPEISKLTGIQEVELMREGNSLSEAFDKLRAFAQGEDLVQNPVTWGGPDGEELREQLGLSLDGWMFGRRWLDVKTLHAANSLAAGLSAKGGLARSMLQYSLRFEGRKHNAKDDAVNTLRLFFEMTRRTRANLPAIDVLT